MKQERIPLTEVELEVVEAIEPLTYQVLVRPIEAAAQTEGGILLTRETQKKNIVTTNKTSQNNKTPDSQNRFWASISGHARSSVRGAAKQRQQ